MNISELRDLMPEIEQAVSAVAQKSGDHYPSVIIYMTVLKHIVHSRAFGACHRYSAVLYLLLSEFEARRPADAAEDVSLLIGVVGSLYGGRFDHSWVQYGPCVYDPTVCLPCEGGGRTDGPVFASHDLPSNRLVHPLYTKFAGDSLDEVAEKVAGWSLSEYSDYLEREKISSLWETVAEIGELIGFPLDAALLRAKYGEVQRTRSQATPGSDS